MDRVGKMRLAHKDHMINKILPLKGYCKINLPQQLMYLIQILKGESVIEYTSLFFGIQYLNVYHLYCILEYDPMMFLYETFWFHTISKRNNINIYLVGSYYT